MTDKPTITQADRDAAYNFNLYETAASILGDGEIRRLASYFAKHRESSVAELQVEVERMQSTLRDICIHSNSDWAQVSSNPAAAIEKIHAIAINAYYGKDGLAQKEPVE